MNFKLALIMIGAIVGIAMLYIASLNVNHKQQETMTTIQPLDLTITYCESCKRCTTTETLDALEFEECYENEIPCLV